MIVEGHAERRNPGEVSRSDETSAVVAFDYVLGIRIFGVDGHYACEGEVSRPS